MQADNIKSKLGKGLEQGLEPGSTAGLFAGGRGDEEVGFPTFRRAWHLGGADAREVCASPLPALLAQPQRLPVPEADVSPANQRWWQLSTSTCFPERLPSLAGPVLPRVTLPTKDPLLGSFNPQKRESWLAPSAQGLGKRKAGNTPYETGAQRAGETQIKG